jgi:hypothetical protein
LGWRNIWLMVYILLIVICIVSKCLTHWSNLANIFINSFHSCRLVLELGRAKGWLLIFIHFIHFLYSHKLLIFLFLFCLYFLLYKDCILIVFNHYNICIFNIISCYFLLVNIFNRSWNSILFFERFHRMSYAFLVWIILKLFFLFKKLIFSYKNWLSLIEIWSIFCYLFLFILYIITPYDLMVLMIINNNSSLF